MNGNDDKSKRKAVVPTNAATIIFCYIEGALLSIPVGRVEQAIFSYEPPPWAGKIYWPLIFCAFIGLPIWYIVYRRKYPMLTVAALGSIAALFILCGLMLPAVN
jgi:hypothetical protein